MPRWLGWTAALAMAIPAVFSFDPIRQAMLVSRASPDERTDTRATGDWRVPELHRKQRRLLLLMVDGLSATAFEKALADNRLPNLQKLMNTRPTVAMTAVSTFPSATSPSVQEMLSGRYAELDYLASPGAIHSFDREERRVVRYVTDPDAWQWPLPTIFDALEGEPVVTVFEGRWDGPTAILTQYNMASQAILSALGASALSSGDAGPVRVFLDIVRSDHAPVLSLVVLNEFDMAAHFFGPASEEAQRALDTCDRLIGQILETMASIAGPGGTSLLDETTILVFGDHGVAGSGQFIDLPTFFADADVKAVDVSTIPHIVFRERLGPLWTQWPDVILVAGGSNVTQVYLRRPSGGWSDAAPPAGGEAGRTARIPSVEKLAGQLAQIPGVDHVIRAVADGGIRIDDGENAATIFERSASGVRRFAYVVSPDAVADPLGYLADPATAGLTCRADSAPGDNCFHDAPTWTDQSIGSRYPGAVPLVPKAFRPSRFAGDLIVTARSGYSFLRNQNGDHGNLTREAILTPLVLNGPGVYPCIETRVPRLVDLYPTAAVLLGAAVNDPAFAHLDGRVLDCVREPSVTGTVR